MCRTIVLWGSCGATVVTLLIFLYLCCMDGLCPHHGATSATPAGGGATGDYESGPCADQDISGSRWIRLAMFLTSVVLIAACAVITLVSLPSEPKSARQEKSAGSAAVTNGYYSTCAYPATLFIYTNAPHCWS
jgi:hypothetical protein